MASQLRKAVLKRQFELSKAKWEALSAANQKTAAFANRFHRVTSVPNLANKRKNSVPSKENLFGRAIKPRFSGNPALSSVTSTDSTAVSTRKSAVNRVKSSTSQPNITGAGGPTRRAQAIPPRIDVPRNAARKVTKKAAPAAAATKKYVVPERDESNPRQYGDQTIEAIGHVLAQVVSENDRYLQNKDVEIKEPKVSGDILKSFNEPGSPQSPKPYDVYKFIYNMSYRMRFQREGAVAMLAYVDRLIEETGLVLNKNNWRKVCFTAMMLSQKVWDDYSYDNSDYRKLYPGLHTDEVNTLERQFLHCVEYNMAVSPDLYTKYRAHLQALYKGKLELGDPPAASPMPKRGSKLRGSMFYDTDADEALPFTDLSLAAPRAKAQQAQQTRGRGEPAGLGQATRKPGARTESPLRHSYVPADRKVRSRRTAGAGNNSSYAGNTRTTTPLATSSLSTESTAEEEARMETETESVDVDTFVTANVVVTESAPRSPARPTSPGRALAMDQAAAEEEEDEASFCRDDSETVMPAREPRADTRSAALPAMSAVPANLPRGAMHCRQRADDDDDVGADEDPTLATESSDLELEDDAGDEALPPLGSDSSSSRRGGGEMVATTADASSTDGELDARVEEVRAAFERGTLGSNSVNKGRRGGRRSSSSTRVTVTVRTHTTSHKKRPSSSATGVEPLFQETKVERMAFDRIALDMRTVG